jgi:hypothetical protein
MTLFVGWDVSQKMTSVCVVDDTGRRVWRGQCCKTACKSFQILGVNSVQ